MVSVIFNFVWVPKAHTCKFCNFLTLDEQFVYSSNFLTCVIVVVYIAVTLFNLVLLQVIRMELLRTGHPCTHKLLIDNISSAEKVSFSLVLLKGSIKVCNINSPCNSNHCENVELVNLSTDKTSKWPIVNKKFKCLADLLVGENCLVLRYCRTDFKINLHYSPRKTEFCVTPLYIICKDHDGRFQSPNGYENSVEAACCKIGLGARLIQCLTAEKLYECGYERRTFQLERDLGSAQEECVQFHSRLSVSEARSMAQEDLWTYFGREIMSSSLSSSHRKFLAFLSCTLWDGTTRKVVGLFVLF